MSWMTRRCTAPSRRRSSATYGSTCRSPTRWSAGARDAYLHDPTVTQSKLEDRFLRLCRRYRIPLPQTQYGEKPRVDFIWPGRRLIVEVDG
jgi:hypothetical protein